MTGRSHAADARTGAKRFFTGKVGEMILPSSLSSKAKFLLQNSLESTAKCSRLAAATMGYSKFRKAFRVVTGQSPTSTTSTANWARQRLLRSTTLSVSEIAYQTGLNPPALFLRIFRRNGMSPKAFRIHRDG